MIDDPGRPFRISTELPPANKHFLRPKEILSLVTARGIDMTIDLADFYPICCQSEINTNCVFSFGHGPTILWSPHPPEQKTAGILTLKKAS